MEFRLTVEEKKLQLQSWNNLIMGFIKEDALYASVNLPLI